MKFIGIDLGWKSQPSGLCSLKLVDNKLQIIDIKRIDSISDILYWIDSCVQSGENAMIAVDAPTLIPNETGSRLPDKLTHKYFGKYHAGCYPANLGLAFAERTVNFGLELEKRGYNHAPSIEPQKTGRYQIEVFPHPAIVNLFGLERILKYKKGRLAERRLELVKLHDLILQVLPSLPLSLYSTNFSDFIPSIPSTGKLMKEVEDKLDSIICAYVAAHWWYWGEQCNLVLGDETTGYIVTPQRKELNNCRDRNSNQSLIINP
ncbi:MAG: DUF429 domain-containing protein [Cyanobacteria bacterium P01_A01_bin.84]